MTNETQLHEDLLPKPFLIAEGDEHPADGAMLLDLPTDDINDVQNIAVSQYARKACDQRAYGMFGEGIGQLEEPTYFRITESVIALTQQFFAFCLNKQGFYETMKDNWIKAYIARDDARIEYKQQEEAKLDQQDKGKITIKQKKPEVRPPRYLSLEEAAQIREEKKLAKEALIAKALAKKAKAETESEAKVGSDQGSVDSTQKCTKYRPDTTMMIVLISFIKQDNSEQKVCFFSLSGHNYILPNQPGESFKILAHQYNYNNCELFDDVVKEFQALPRSESIKFFFLGKNSDTADLYFRGIYQKINEAEDDKVRELFGRNCAETKIAHFLAKFSASFGDHYKILGSIAVSLFPSNEIKHDNPESYIRVGDTFFLKKPACESCMKKKESIMLGITTIAERAVLHGAKPAPVEYSPMRLFTQSSGNGVETFFSPIRNNLLTKR